MTAYPDHFVPPGTTVLPVDLLIIVPYVEGMLRDETMAAVHASGQAYLTQRLDESDPYDYAARLREWWNLPMDLVIVEQDVVPTVGQFDWLVRHPDPWVSASYHIGDDRYAVGLGFCKIAHRLRTAHPNAGVNISLDPRNARELIGWRSLNENVERHLTRLGETMTILGTSVTHLHYPEPARV